jgi:pyruvate dehydrogenase complex dehydrogenase (E1) component
VFRDRLQLPIPDSELEDGDPPYWHPGLDSPEYEYMTARRRALDGPVPERIVRKKTLTLPADGTYADVLAGTGEKVKASTTTAFARLLRNLLRDPGIGTRVVPIIPDEARRSASTTSPSMPSCSSRTAKRATAGSSRRASPKRVRWRRSRPRARRTRRGVSR